jgi:hypothetical protein
MGLKDWMAKKLVGVSGYGEAMGREVVSSGIALGRTLYVGHGTRSTPSTAFVFEDINQMMSAGFDPYCPDPTHQPPLEDPSVLSKQCRALGIAFAVRCSITAASNFFASGGNQDTFQRSLGSSNRSELERLNLGISLGDVLHYLKLPVFDKVSEVLNLEKPGIDDGLAVFLGDLSKSIPNVSVGFQRTGLLGFDVVAVPIAEQTLLSVHTASQKFGW